MLVFRIKITEYDDDGNLKINDYYDVKDIHVTDRGYEFTLLNGFIMVCKTLDKGPCYIINSRNGVV